ncbi:hypothetical protein ACFSRY_12830 [Pontibacter locisalis]|uniref:GTPase n=1 Tax=Pontibacter locisalis TaxID=1719035 RepID=A0ABW5IP48_9BACT
MKPKLLFVYNADTGFFNKLTDFAHKIVSPDTYACSLCALTYGNLTVKQEWAKYIKQLPLEVEFIYKNEWEFTLSHSKFPLIALQTNDDTLELLLGADELNKLQTLDQLKEKLDKELLKLDLS